MYRAWSRSGEGDTHYYRLQHHQFREMGSGNTSPSAVFMHLFTGIELEKCIGAGAGLDTPGIRHKYDILSEAITNYAGEKNAEAKIAWFGGYEMAMAMGSMMQSAELGMIILVDGFIMTSVILAASQFYPHILDYAIFGHQETKADISECSMRWESMHSCTSTSVSEKDQGQYAPIRS